MSNIKELNDRLEAHSQQLKEPAGMTEKRLAAARLVDELDFPKIERSHYYRWLPLDTDNFDQPVNTGTELLPVNQTEEGAYLRTFHNEILDKHLPEDLADQGAIFTTISEALEAHADLIEKYYMTDVVALDQDKLSAHHYAYMNAGVFLYIPKNVEVKDPVQLHMIQDATSQKPFNQHVLIVMEENSQASFVEKMATEGSETTPANIVVEILAKENARINYSTIDELGETTSAFVRRQAVCEAGANVDWAIGSMSNGNIVLDAYTELRGRGSQSDLKIVSLTHGDQEQIINSHVLNIGAQTAGNIFQHGAILDQSRLTFNAIGKIEKGAKDADAQQESRLLMFSDGARGDANPILLIEEYEVTAGHAASVGQIDEEQLYYLMSRGIHRKEAMRLAIRGFLGPVIEAIPLNSVREELIENIERKLQSL